MITPGLVVAVGRNGEIGYKGNLIWHIRKDLRHFKEVTMGHPVIMGRKTWDSLPKGALPGRRNIVITRNSSFEAPGADVVSSLADALALCEGSELQPYIIGGESIYRQALPLCDTAYLTIIHEQFADADARFPMQELLADFEPCDESETISDEPHSEHTFHTVTYRRIKSEGCNNQ